MYFRDSDRGGAPWRVEGEVRSRWSRDRRGLRAGRRPGAEPTTGPGAGSGAGPTTDVVATPSPPRAVPPGRLIRVPADLPTPRAAIDAAAPGDVILLAAGHLRRRAGGPEGQARHHDPWRGPDTVVFDGKGLELTAIEVEADGVTLENLSAHDFGVNGFYWEKVEGFTGAT